MITKFDYKILEDINIKDYLESFHLSKSKIYKLFFEKKILVNNEIVKDNYLLKENDILTIIIDEEIDFIPEKSNLEILYEDPYYLIINKPRGFIIYDDSKDKTNTLSNLVAGYYKDKGYHLNVRFCHRLDKDTTGVIVLCKDILCHAYMNYYISLHDIRREYHLLAKGKLKNKKGFISKPLGKDRHNSNKMVVTNNGMEAKTNYEVIKEFNDYSYVKAILENGRKHQIRVHFQSIGNPLLGDILYGDTKITNYLCLHSYSISFIHPVYKKNITVYKEEPKEFLDLLRR